jgi:nitrogen-specific signal transduction histidine kinase
MKSFINFKNIIEVFQKNNDNNKHLDIVKKSKTPSNSSISEDNLKLYLKAFIHELRTPISAISMGLSLLEGEQTKEEKTEIIEMMQDTICFIENIFTKFAFIQNGKIQLNQYEPFSINSLFHKIFNIFQFEMENNNIEVKYNIQPDVYDWVYGDSYNIVHVITNLIKNSVKYRNRTKKTTIFVQISKKQCPKPQYTLPPIIRNNASSNKYHSTSNRREKTQNLFISVIDNNEYIPIDIKAHLFEKYNSTSGSGLGLYICKNIIELHGGQISHQYNENAMGNQFNITLSMELCETLELQKNDERYRRNSKTSYVIQEKELCYQALLVDDVCMNNKMLNRILMRTNLFTKILTLQYGNEIINILDLPENTINVIFLDKNLQNERDGINFAKQIRDYKYNQLIFGVTGDDDSLENGEFINAGVDYIFIKPINDAKINMMDRFIRKYGTTRKEDKMVKLVHEELEWI